MKDAQSCRTLCDPMDYTIHGILQARILKWVAFPFSRRPLPNPEIEPKSPTLQVAFWPAELQGKPQNTGMGSLSLFQWIFPTQELNWVSCIAGRFFTNWAIREAHFKVTILQLKINKLAAVDCGLCWGSVKDLKIIGWKPALKAMDWVNLERSLPETRRPWLTP